LVIEFGREDRRDGKEETMCLTCGCGILNDDHGDPAHITYDDFKKAADAAEISTDEALKNLQETLAKAG
jgi:hypothetical protein